jgi:phenylacetate-coenzyme A ligase PaaK-like adenylate-forming protein
MVDALNAFQPEGLTTYPTIVAQLAECQLAGELQIAPRMVATSGEVRTVEMTERIKAAWGREPFDYYGASEAGFMAADCDRHSGLHVFEDQVWLEVVDEDFQPVPPGRPGSRLLLTNLFNRTQPLIRYELNDLLTVSPASCPCGRPFPLLESVAGRSDDLLELPAVSGGTVTVHPLTLRSPLTRIAALSEYRIVYRRGELSVDAVLPGGGGEGTCAEIKERLGTALAERGATALPIHVKRVGEIPRHPRSGKLKAIDVECG